MKWWMTKGNNGVHTIMLQCLPSLICWEIWKSRCAANFENIRMSARHIINQVSNTITLILNCQFTSLQLPHSWIDKCIVVEKMSLVIHSQIVYWRKLVSGYVKLNVDGCSKGNPGSARGGGIIRDHHGDLVMAFFDFYGICSNNFAEVKAVLQGIQMCCHHGLKNIVVESDSLLIINMINRKTKAHWQIIHELEQIWELTRTGDFQFKHIFREGNKIADQLANLGEVTKTHGIFNQAVPLPREVRASLKFKQEEIPNFRFRVKRNFFVINDIIN
ncbi:hypothetical protein A4A49_62368 [Nicotiana attenuata]|uniref:RNase H type-1 domain-containing protein n=1 Tax=Nicotiana attenuata TaxID=49451 RepID=A0A1J6IH68_NICAT|nr:hypothetical protein A4A49_62368 [Nicotiana attenuata]